MQVDWKDSFLHLDQVLNQLVAVVAVGESTLKTMQLNLKAPRLVGFDKLDNCLLQILEFWMLPY